MSLLISPIYPSDYSEENKHYIDGKAKVVRIIESDNDFWPGQQKHVIWLETHNEDCDARIASDMDWSKNVTEDNKPSNS